MIKNKDSMVISLKREVDDSYEIFFGVDLFSKIAKDLKEKPLGKRYAIITDSNVEKLYAYSLQKYLKEQGIISDIFSFPAGEMSKNLDTVKEIILKMNNSGYGRDSAILALGGGVVGDLAGFVASIFNRGIPYIQIPTTLLAEADSSIGGKTAVDLNFIKNFIGTFKQPSAVYIDVVTLKTLSPRIYISGIAETIKHAIIRDADFFSYLEKNVDLILNRDLNVLIEVAKNNCRIKGEIVEADFDEKNLRKILNYGHTIGHAVESLSLMKGENVLFHGEAVSIGMVVEGKIANELGYFSLQDLERQKDLLLRFCLPTKISNNISIEEIISMSLSDKKNKDGKVQYVLPTKIGEMNEFNGSYISNVNNKLVEDILRNSFN